MRFFTCNSPGRVLAALRTVSAPGSEPVGPVGAPFWTRETRARTGPYSLDPYVPKRLRVVRARTYTGTDFRTTPGPAGSVLNPWVPYRALA